jgi:hypothetical protein
MLRQMRVICLKRCYPTPPCKRNIEMTPLCNIEEHSRGFWFFFSRHLSSQIVARSWLR